MTILTAAQDAARLLSLPVPSSLVGSSDPTAALLLALANRGGRALAKRYAWEGLVKEHTFTSVATTAQTGAIPSDFGRLIPETAWNRTTRRQLHGPVEADEWSMIQATTTRQVTPTYRIRGGSFLLSPATAGETIAYEYVSKHWAYTGSTYADNYATDSYVPVWSEELTVLDLVWRYKQAKGREFAPDELAFERAVADLITSDGGTRVIDLTEVAPRSNRRPCGPTKLQIPESI